MEIPSFFHHHQRLHLDACNLSGSFLQHSASFSCRGTISTWPSILRKETRALSRLIVILATPDGPLTRRLICPHRPSSSGLAVLLYKHDIGHLSHHAQAVSQLRLILPPPLEYCAISLSFCNIILHKYGQYSE